MLGIFLFVVVSYGRSIRVDIDDGTLTACVRIALLNDPEVGRYRFDAEIYQGMVRLADKVSTVESVVWTFTVVRKIAKARNVRSTIRVMIQ